MKPTFVLLLTALGLCALGCGGSGAADAEKPADGTPAATTAPPPLPEDVREVASVARPAQAEDTTEKSPAPEPASGPVVANGELVSPVRSELSVKNPGRVARVYVEEGARVRRGQTLLTLESDYVALELKRAEAEVSRAKANAGEAERDFERKKELLAKQSVSQAAFDRSLSALESARAAVAAAEAARDLASQKLQDAALVSPLTGVVAERRTDPGERLGDNTVAFVVAQTSPIKVRFRMPERYLATLREGQPVRATVDPYPGEVFTGKVTQIGGVVDPATRTVQVETLLANTDGRLSPGLFARVEIDLK
ncbi:MAG TPA: hypothetical protein DD490_32230 [Acidobacteria bacterium]|nr:hypothetical protein [Acidobacteriota bacterium]